MEVKLTWADFKTNVTSRSLEPQWFIKGSAYNISAFDKQIQFTTSMDIEIATEESADQLDFEANYKALWNKPLNTVSDSVRTEKEKSDITLKMASGTVVSDANGLAVLDIKVPGTLGSTDGRYVKGGTAWFTNFRPNDNFQVHVVDVDNILGYGAGTVVGSYTEDGPNAGFFAEPTGMVNVITLGFFGFVNSGLYLRMTGQCGAGTTDTLYMNIIWGKKA